MKAGSCLVIYFNIKNLSYAYIIAYVFRLLLMPDDRIRIHKFVSGLEILLLSKELTLTGYKKVRQLVEKAISWIFCYSFRTV